MPGFRTLTLLLLIVIGCAGHAPTATRIRVSGSDTMLVLLQELATQFMTTNPGLSVHVEGGGTATGVVALLHGRAEICAASRPLRPQETQQLAERFRRLGVSTMVARDALSIYLNPQSPVRDLSLQQLRGIFMGDLTNWRDVGGVDAVITVLNRPPNSGTHLFFREHVLGGGEYDRGAAIIPGTAAIVEAVRQDSTAIGYGGLAYGRGVRLPRIDGVKASAATIRSGQYPISRYLYLVTIDKPRGTTRRFIDWVLSEEGQRIVQDVGYVPLRPVAEELSPP